MNNTTNLLVPSLPSTGLSSSTTTVPRFARPLRLALPRVMATVFCGVALMAPFRAPAPPLPAANPGAASVPGITAAPAVVFLAQIDPKDALKAFLEFLSWVLIALGVCLVAYGAILNAQGRHLDGVVALSSGFILVLTVPIVYYFAKIAGIQF